VTAGRVVGVGLLALGAVLIAWVLLGGNGETEYKLRFQTAGQLVNDNDVQIGGRRIGLVKNIELTSDNQAEITIAVQEPYAPLHEGTTAQIRMTSLSGVANRYVQLSPGPDSNPELDEGATLSTDRTTTVVDIDQFFNIFTPKAGKGLQDVIQGFGAWYEGKGVQGNEVAKYFAPALESTRRLAEKLNADEPALEGLVKNTSKVVEALGSEAPTLTEAVSNSNTALGAIAQENAALAEALDYLPQTLRRGSTTFVNLRATLDDLTELVDVSKASTKDLAPFLAELRPLLVEAKPTIAQLDKLIRQPGANNDLTDLLNDAPSLASEANTSFPAADKALREATPIFGFWRPYSPELVGWLRSFGQTFANYDANGRYARVAPAFNAFNYDQGSGTLKALTPAQRQLGTQAGPSIVPRCPGGTTQRPADGSAPWRDTSGTLDCDPSIVPPGP
jgi:phospholipid/cholesterol/gamma-HCH transport system substrate-binding protein